MKKSEFLSLKKASSHPWDMKNGCKVVDKLVSISMNANDHRLRECWEARTIRSKRTEAGIRKWGAGLAGWYCRAGCGTSSHFGDEISLSNPAPCFICPSIRESFPQPCSNSVRLYTSRLLLSIIHNRLGTLLNPLTRVGGSQDVGLSWKLLFLLNVFYNSSSAVKKKISLFSIKIYQIL